MKNEFLCAFSDSLIKLFVGQFFLRSLALSLVMLACRPSGIPNPASPGSLIKLFVGQFFLLRTGLFLSFFFPLFFCFIRHILPPV
jgi:hypothetical protein